MNSNHKELLSIAMTIFIVAISLYIIHRFIPSLIWASIIVITTYPLYCRWRVWFGAWKNASALAFTIILSSLFFLPLSWLLSILVQEFHLFINYLHAVNQSGQEAPTFFQELPIIGNDLVSYWNNHIGKPGNIKSMLSNMHLSLTPTGNFIKEVGGSVLHRGVQIGFTLLSVFFLYRDGDTLLCQLHKIGEYCFGQRWYRYADKLPSALRATVNGTIVVGLGVGVLMGICYALIGFPAPTLMGFFTAFASMIPFAVPLVFGVVALILLSHGAMIAACIVLIWGTLVMFVADHFIKPVLIGGATQLPFLAVLFGILGGLENLGVLGLFVGPMVMVLFINLWYESQGIEHKRQIKISNA